MAASTSITSLTAGERARLGRIVRLSDEQRHRVLVFLNGYAPGVVDTALDWLDGQLTAE